MTLFLQQKDESDSVWNGPRTGTKGAVRFGADESYDISLLAARLKNILGTAATIYVDMPGVAVTSRYRNARAAASKAKGNLFDYLVPGSASTSAASDFDEVISILEGGKGRIIKSASAEVEALRVIKSTAEINIMRKAAQISAKAHADVRAAHRNTGNTTDDDGATGDEIRHDARGNE